MAKICKIDEYTHYIALLTIIFLIAVFVNDENIPVRHVNRKVAKVAHVGRITENVVPGEALHRLLWHNLLAIKLVHNLLVLEIKLVLIEIVAAFFDKPLTVTEFYCFKEVGQVLINLNGVTGDYKSPLFHTLVAKSANRDQAEQDPCNHEHWH